ncbi:protein B4-like [Lacerta agilis]|uniref:protein B4-like n=1 Tax=Lacerta agilis TaxID=80427 RepID=UPI00141A285D|nr:protein B4-like [Lacerta agilis]
MEAVKTLDERNGVSVVAIKRYPRVDPIHLKYAQGLERGCLIRPQNSSALGAMGRFKLGTEEAKGKKSQEKHSNLDGKTVPKPKKAAKKPKVKIPVEKEGSWEKKEAAPSKTTKVKASKHQANLQQSPRQRSTPRGRKQPKSSRNGALPRPSRQTHLVPTPWETVFKESKRGAEAKAPAAAKKTKEAKGEKAKAGQGSKPPTAKGGREGENPASWGPKEA